MHSSIRKGVMSYFNSFRSTVEWVKDMYQQGTDEQFTKLASKLVLSIIREGCEKHEEPYRITQLNRQQVLLTAHLTRKAIPSMLMMLYKKCARTGFMPWPKWVLSCVYHCDVILNTYVCLLGRPCSNCLSHNKPGMTPATRPC